MFLVFLNKTNMCDIEMIILRLTDIASRRMDIVDCNFRERIGKVGRINHQPAGFSPVCVCDKTIFNFNVTFFFYFLPRQL